MTKSEARQALLDLLKYINGPGRVSTDITFGRFLKEVFFPFYRRKWKRSTASTSGDRIRFHLGDPLKDRIMAEIARDELQSLLDDKANQGLSFSTVDHLRWDLRQIFRLAATEGVIVRNPAELLFTPREIKKKMAKRSMTLQEVKQLLALDLGLRERLVIKLAVLAGMRPGEIFGLRRGSFKGDHLKVTERVYRSDVDSPKTTYSERDVAIPESAQADINAWLLALPGTPKDWMFPSEKVSTPIAKDNLWRKHIRPVLEKADLEWVNFQVMRRANASLMKELDVDPKTVADQLGHTVDVNQNVYTSVSVEIRSRAVQILEAAVLEAPDS